MHPIGTGGGRTLIAIIYHSAYGHTRRQAEAVWSGVGDVDGAEALRALLVIGSAMSLIFAGPALPF